MYAIRSYYAHFSAFDLAKSREHTPTDIETAKASIARANDNSSISIIDIKYPVKIFSLYYNTHFNDIVYFFIIR